MTIFSFCHRNNVPKREDPPQYDFLKSLSNLRAKILFDEEVIDIGGNDNIDFFLKTLESEETKDLLTGIDNHGGKLTLEIAEIIKDSLLFYENLNGNPTKNTYKLIKNKLSNLKEKISEYSK